MLATYRDEIHYRIQSVPLGLNVSWIQWLEVGTYVTAEHVGVYTRDPHAAGGLLRSLGDCSERDLKSFELYTRSQVVREVLYKETKDGAGGLCKLDRVLVAINKMRK